MPQRRNLPKGYWRDMKATICDFCGKVVGITNRAAMLYDVLICAGESCEATRASEKALLFNAEDVCSACTERVHAALVQLRQELRPKDQAKKTVRRR